MDQADVPVMTAKIAAIFFYHNRLQDELASLRMHVDFSNVAVVTFFYPKVSFKEST